VPRELTLRSISDRISAMKPEDNLLAAIAGYVDTLSFVALFGLFTAHVTGNFVLIGADVAGFGQGIFMKLMAFPAFIVGVVLSSALVKIARPKGASRSAAVLYSAQAALLLAFCVSCIAAQPVVSAAGVPVVVCGMLGAAAMGVQNAHGRLIARAGVPNTVMTGNVTQAVLDAIDIVSSEVPADAKTALRARLGKTLQAVACFSVGAIAGALAYRHVSFWALLLPFALLVWLALAARRDRADTADREAVPGSHR
jgi:uncharacterized membrane protein YoaK (UPF0700 family)